MRRLIAALPIGAVLLAAIGCAYGPVDTVSVGTGSIGTHVTPVMPPPGYLFSQVQAPLSVDYHNTPARPPKQGESSSLYILVPIIDLSFAWMDRASLAEAARAGGLSRIDYADYEIFNVLGIFQRFTITAYGQ